MTELLLSGVALAALLLYHLRLFLRIARQPERTAFGRHRIARRRWLDHFAGGGHDIFVVQTMRNWLMSATFLASTSIVVAFGVLGIMTTTDKLSGLAHELGGMGSADTSLLLAKFLSVLLLYLAAFFVFTFAVRFLTHAGFVVNIPRGPEALPIGPHEDLEKGAMLYFIGLRCLYLSIPLAMWLMGPLALLGATALVLGVLVLFD